MTGIESLRPGSRAFYGTALVATGLAYLIVLTFISGLPFQRALISSLANIAPIAVGAIVIRAVMHSWLAKQGWPVMLLGHCVMAAIFALFWFWLLMILLGIVSGQSPVVFSVRPFLGEAAAWQLMQGVFVYAVIALLVHMEALARKGAANQTAEGEPEAAKRFVKIGDELHPLDPDRIIQISAAGDYAELHTVSGTHMLRTTLTELETTLGNAFLRVHRSHIVNANRVARMESAGGGRITLHLDSGDTVITSRAGAKAIRTRVL